MSLPHLPVATESMSYRGLIFLGFVVALGVTGLASIAESKQDVLTLERGLGAEVETTYL